jgi:hypothetical protein
MSNGANDEMYLVPNRDCGPCTVCCKDLTIEELKKVPGIACVHLAGNRCGIYGSRPTTCREFYCGWRQLPDLDDGWRPDLCEILINGADHRLIPVGYRRDGLTFEMIGSPDKVSWQPFVDAICALISNSIPVFLAMRGEPGWTSGNVFLNDTLSGAVAADDQKKIVQMLLAARQACIAQPRRKVEFGG